MVADLLNARLSVNQVLIPLAYLTTRSVMMKIILLLLVAFSAMVSAAPEAELEARQSFGGFRVSGRGLTSFRFFRPHSMHLLARTLWRWHLSLQHGRRLCRRQRSRLLSRPGGQHPMLPRHSLCCSIPEQHQHLSQHL